MKNLFFLIFTISTHPLFSQITKQFDGPNATTSAKVVDASSLAIDPMTLPPLEWKKFTGVVPKKIAVVGVEGAIDAPVPQCPCKSSWGDIGKFLVGENTCYIGINQIEYAAPEFSLLIENYPEHKRTRFTVEKWTGKIPKNAFVASDKGAVGREWDTQGHGLEIAQKVYIGVFIENNGQHIGRIYQNGHWSYTWGGKIITKNTPGYERIKPYYIVVVK